MVVLVDRRSRKAWSWKSQTLRLALVHPRKVSSSFPFVSAIKLTTTQPLAGAATEAADLVIEEAIAVAARTVTMNSNSLDENIVIVDMKTARHRLASSDKSDINSPWTTICQSRSLWAHHHQSLPLAHRCQDFLTIFTDDMLVLGPKKALRTSECPNKCVHERKSVDASLAARSGADVGLGRPLLTGSLCCAAVQRLPCYFKRLKYDSWFIQLLGFLLNHGE